MDGIGLDAIIKAGLVAAGIGLALAAVAWVVKLGKQKPD
jgi:hypothetical protein